MSLNSHPRFGDSLVVVVALVVVDLPAERRVLVLLSFEHREQALMDADVLLLRLHHPDSLLPHLVDDPEDVHRVRVGDLLNDDCTFKSYKQLEEKFEVKCNFLQMSQVRHSLTLYWRNIVCNSGKIVPLAKTKFKYLIILLSLKTWIVRCSTGCLLHKKETPTM